MVEGDNALIFNAAQRLRPELLDLLASADAKELDELIANTSNAIDDPAAKEQMVIVLLEVIERHPQVHKRFTELVTHVEHVQASRYQPVPGKPIGVEPGSLYVCPVDPDHYQEVLQFKGEQLWCSEHEVDLVPEANLNPRRES